MIRAIVSGEDGRKAVLLGIDGENLRRLLNDEPIRVNLRHLDPTGDPVDGMPDIDVVIFDAEGDKAVQLLRRMQRG
jgi:hypothetical protein